MSINDNHQNKKPEVKQHKKKKLDHDDMVDLVEDVLVQWQVKKLKTFGVHLNVS